MEDNKAEKNNNYKDKQTASDNLSGKAPKNNIKNPIAILSGKGGVGKSLLTSLLAIATAKKKYKVGILDADITGPSIPKIFGLGHKRAEGTKDTIYPVESAKGIKIISANLLLPNEDAPIIWRGPLIANAVKQFWTDVLWGELDYLFFDMPPGTGDIPLTVFQTVPLAGIIIVTSPQDLVSLIVKKAINMAKKMNIPILGLVENLSYATCPKCGEHINIFGKSNSETVAAETKIPFLGKLPIDPNLAKCCDSGQIEDYDQDYLSEMVFKLEDLLK